MNFSNLAIWWASISTTELVWLTIGFSAQAMFTMRFVIQWLASERARRSIVPETFWYFSFAGGLMLFIYAIYRMDPVFILGQGSGLFIYARNIVFIWRAKREETIIAQPAYKPAAE
jgi:lipid-A-disaccharide synthase-like uncharacterized protein